MKLNFKKKVMLLFSVSFVLLLGNVALATCEILRGSLNFSPLRVAIRIPPTQSSVPQIEIKCRTPTIITARRNQPPEWNQFVNRISSSVRDSISGDPLPLENISATFRAQLTELGGNTVRRWVFDMARTDNILMQSDGDSYELKAGVTYRITIDSLRGLITLPFNPAPYHEAGTSNSGLYMTLDTGQQFRVQGEWTSSSTPPVTPTCTASAFTVTVPSTVEFDSMDEDSLKAGHEYKKSFSIVVVKKPNQGCKNTTTPSVTFSAASATSGQPYAKIPERGLLLSIYQGRTKAILDFGVRSDLAVQSGTSIVTEAYEGRIKKDIYAKVTPGPFSTTVTYAMSYR